jgi:hypothetical protein
VRVGEVWSGDSARAKQTRAAIAKHSQARSMRLPSAAALRRSKAGEAPECSHEGAWLT